MRSPFSKACLISLVEIFLRDFLAHFVVLGMHTKCTPQIFEQERELHFPIVSAAFILSMGGLDAAVWDGHVHLFVQAKGRDCCKIGSFIAQECACLFFLLLRKHVLRFLAANQCHGLLFRLSWSFRRMIHCEYS